jgi:catechol 2,3-dioxygenase-like lactoylglutathione lyase family enzyme
MRIKRLTPMLNVSDIERSLDFYQKLAGFELVAPRGGRPMAVGLDQISDGELMLESVGR